MPETGKGEDNRRIEAYRSAVLERDGHSKNIGNDVYLTVNEAAVLAGVNPATVHKWIKKWKSRSSTKQQNNSNSKVGV